MIRSPFKTFSLTLLIYFGIFSCAFAQVTGTVTGKIVEQLTQQPIRGASVTLQNTRLGTVTDSTGMFVIQNVSPGIYSVLITNVGFQQKVVGDVTVIRSKTFYLEAGLLDDNSSLKEVTIRGYQGENNPLVPVSSYSFSREEIFRSPGSQGDIFRALGILPGVTSSGGQYSAIAVRGQGTSDNVYIVDDIPLFQVTHLEIEGFNAGFNDPNGGRFSIFAPLVVDNALFEGGGFAARYGRKSSSYLGLEIKEGNHETPFFDGQFDLLGFTLNYDGPSGLDKKTSVFASARYQNFSLLEKLVNLTSAGTPSYGDYLLKTTTNLDAKNKLTFIAMFNPEKYVRSVTDVGDSKNLTDDNNSNFIGLSKTSKAMIGLNLRTLTGKSSYWKNIFYYRALNVNNDLGYAYPAVDTAGNIISKNNIPSDPGLRHIKNDQGELGYRSIFTKHTQYVTLIAGLDLARVDLNYARILKHTDTLYTYTQSDVRPDPAKDFLVLQPAQFNSLFKRSAFNASGYVDISVRLFNHLTLNPGLRYDYTGFAKQGAVSPRFSGSYGFDEKQSLNFAAGIYYQDPAYADVASQPGDRTLKNERTTQYILGYRVYFSSDLKFIAEGWYKRFDDLVINPSTGQSLLNNNGTGHAYGADINLTKRLSEKYYGQIGYSYMLSKRDDHDGLGPYNYIFSQPNAISLLGSYQPNSRWIFAGKFRYATGRPTDTYVLHADVLDNPSYLRYSQEITAKNGSRLPDFISLDLRADYKIQMQKSALTLFVDIVDVLNRFNQSAEIFQPLTGKTYDLGLAVFPSFGIRVKL
jgi:hypothetical protein